MHHSQKNLFPHFALSMIVIFSLVSVLHCFCGFFMSTSYAAQADEEAVVPEEEQAVSQATPEESSVKSGEAKDDKTSDAKTKDDTSRDSTSVATMSTMSGFGGGDNIYGAMTAITDISQFSGSASAKISIEVPPGRLGIHLNPLRAHIVPDIQALNRYPYTGHSAIMGKYPRQWQDTDAVLSYFGEDLKQARRKYLEFIEKGMNEGARTDLTGGGLVRSMGGWEEIGRHRNERIKSDQRILGSSAFVMKILAEKEESLKRSYALKQKGHTLENIGKKAASLFGLKSSDLHVATKEKRYVNARSIFCYWAVRELGISVTEMARRLNMTQPAITYAVKRGRILAEKGNYKL